MSNDEYHGEIKVSREESARFEAILKQSEAPSNSVDAICMSPEQIENLDISEYPAEGNYDKRTVLRTFNADVEQGITDSDMSDWELTNEGIKYFPLPQNPSQYKD